MFCRWLTNETGVSIVVAAELDGAPITLDVRDVTVDEILGMVGRRVGAEVSRQGGIYYLGTLKAEDRGVLVRRVRRMSGDELTAALNVLMSDVGRAECHADGVILVADRVEILGKIRDMLDQVENLQSAAWVVQLYMLSLSESDSRELGLDIVPAVDIATAFASASQTGNVAAAVATGRSATASAGLNAVLKTSRQGGGNRVVAEPLFVLADGGHGQFQRGKRIPVARKAVSNQGTVTTQSFQYVNAGLTVGIDVRENGADVVATKLDIEMSALDSYNDGAPVTSVESFQADVLLAAGGTYLLGCLKRTEESSLYSGLLATGGKRSEGGGVLQVWARLARVGGPLQTEAVE